MGLGRQSTVARVGRTLILCALPRRVSNDTQTVAGLHGLRPLLQGGAKHQWRFGHKNRTIGSAIWLQEVLRLTELPLLSTERYRSSDVARATLDTTCQRFANNECSYRMRRMNEGNTAAKSAVGFARSILSGRAQMVRTLAMRGAGMPASLNQAAEGQEPRMPEGFKTEFAKDGWHH